MSFGKTNASELGMTLYLLLDLPRPLCLPGLCQVMHSMGREYMSMLKIIISEKIKEKGELEMCRHKIWTVLYVAIFTGEKDRSRVTGSMYQIGG